MSEEVVETAKETGDQLNGRMKESEIWSSRWAFYFAAVGAAVGFGNVWRFPALSVEYGGGAFFIPYFLAFFLIGIPILTLEIAFGQYWQTGDVGVFGMFNRRFAGVGVASVACGFMLVTYYSILVAWVIHAFFDSFTDSAPWADEDVTADAAIAYFYNEIIGLDTVSESGRATRVVWANFGYSALTWFVIFACLSFGTKVTGQITYVTMGIPIIVLFVFLIKSLTLEGASAGVEAYIGQWDVSVLTERGEVWSRATTQIFFSIGITFGIMTAFGAHCKRDEPAFMNAVVIASANSMFSIIAGFAVFAALGHLAFRQGVGVEDLSYGGFSLVFGTWPVVMGTLPGGIHWVRILFFDLFLLGIDSAFALIEGVLTVAADTERFRETPKWKITSLFCFAGFVLSTMYATDAGLNWLDVIDYYINFVMTIVGIFETFGAGWVYGIETQFENCGHKAVYAWMIGANFFPIILACALWFGLESNPALWGFVALIVSSGCGTILTAFFLKQKMDEDPGKWTWGSIWWEVSFSNIFKLRDLVSPVVQHIPNMWCFLIKGFIPQTLIVLFVSAAASETSTGEAEFGGYGGYQSNPYQILGILTFAFAAFLFVIGFIFPQVYGCLAVDLAMKQPIIGKELSGKGDEVEYADDPEGEA